MTKKSVIRLEDVWKIYKLDEVEVPALRGVSLDIKEGEFLAIQGPSGSGKSTMLNSVGCLDTPTKGKIYLDGQDISTLSESDLASIRGKKIGFIFQTFNLIPSLNALDNVALPNVFQGVSREKRERHAKDLLNQVGLGERMDHIPGELSGGERQRVAIARALVNNPSVVLADEPTGNLDSKIGREIIELLFHLHEKEKKTVIMVTHDDNLAKFADRIVKIRDGRIAK